MDSWRGVTAKVRNSGENTLLNDARRGNFREKQRKIIFLKKNTKIFCQFKNSPYLCTRQRKTTILDLKKIEQDVSRDGAVVARWAHNPKVGGSSPPPATRK